MKLLAIIFIFISTIGFSQSINNDSIKADIMQSIFNHLDTLGVNHPSNADCINKAANNHVRYMDRNNFIGHRQTTDGIGDTIIANAFNRVYEFCDIAYEGDGEICAYDVFDDSTDMINNVGDSVLALFLSSPPHKKCLEGYHDFYGIDVIINNTGNQFTVRICIVYGKNLELYNPNFPKTFSINVDAEANYRKENSNIIIR